MSKESTLFKQKTMLNVMTISWSFLQNSGVTKHINTTKHLEDVLFV